MTHLASVGDSSDAAADPRILSRASAYSFSRCSSVFGCVFEFADVEDRAGEESGRFKIVTTGLGRCRIRGLKSSPPPFDKIEKPFCFAAAISCSFLARSCFSCSNRFSSYEEKSKN